MYLFKADEIKIKYYLVVHPMSMNVITDAVLVSSFFLVLFVLFLLHQVSDKVDNYSRNGDHIFHRNKYTLAPKNFTL